MPIFEYACQQCAHTFEVLVRSSTVPECPHCHSRMGSIVIETKPWRKMRQRVRQCLFCHKEFESEELYFVRSEGDNAPTT